MIPVFTREVVEALSDDDHQPCLANCVAWKWGFTAIMFSVAVFGGLIPTLIHRVTAASRARYRNHREPNKSVDSELSLASGREGRVFRLAELYSGGLLFGVALFHLVPEGLEPLHTFEEDRTKGFPFGLAIFSLGFLITVGVEMVAVPVLVEYKRSRKDENFSKAEHSLLSLKDIDDTNDVKSPLTSTLDSPHQDYGTALDGCESAVASAVLGTWQESDKSWHFLGAAAATFAGLSMHAFFAGLSLGLGSLDQAIFLFVAIISHKGFGTFAIGLQLVRAKVSLLTHVAVVTAFALISPLGVVLGLVAHQSVNSITASTLQLLAAGMLFAVAAVGSLGFDAGENKSSAVTGYLAYVTGVLSIGLIFIALAFTGVL